MINNFSSSHIRSELAEARAPYRATGQRAVGAEPQDPNKLWPLLRSVMPLAKGTACGNSSTNFFD